MKLAELQKIKNNSEIAKSLGSKELWDIILTPDSNINPMPKNVKEFIEACKTELDKRETKGYVKLKPMVK